LCSWLVFSVHFATNVVREHYPAFSLVDHFSFKVDEYQGLHPDIFVHRDGHSYVGNNVAVSVLAAIPLFLFDPVLDAVERYSRRKLDAAGGAGVADTVYRNELHPNSRHFFAEVHRRGLDLRFGAATFITTAFFMAPLAALAVVLMFGILVRGGVEAKRASWLAALFGFGTPIFFRAVSLNHNFVLMCAVFLSFAILWRRPDADAPLSVSKRALAGALAGSALAIDYSGVVPLLVLYGYLFTSRLRTASWRTSLRESLVFVAGSVPPVLFLLWSQWVMYGNPFLPGQYWMPAVAFTDKGWRGFDWPSLDLFWLNLFSPGYGLFTWGPLLLLALVPPLLFSRSDRLLRLGERRFVWIFVLASLTFSAANQYSRMQFNSGFRYLIPLVPFLFLLAADHLARLPRRWLVPISALAVLHSWVLTVFREPVGMSWRLFLREGVQLPWLRTVRASLAANGGPLASPWLPDALLLSTLLLVGSLWWYGSRVELRLNALRNDIG